MGLFLSTTRESDLKLPPPVLTREELCRRYRHKVSIGMGPGGGLSDGQKRWFQAVFDTFCSQTESTKYWSESNLKDFLQSCLPTEIALFVADTIPILHRTLLRMGSFPYQNDPEKLLVCDVLCTACILFSDYPEELGGNENNLLVLIFQSMASPDPNKAQGQDYKKPRDEDDDYHLKKALRLVRNQRRDPKNPKIMIKGPANAPPSHFPSSWSKNFDQLIPTAEFRSFLRLMVFLNLYDNCADASNHLQVEKVTNCLLATFQPSTAGITWDCFNQAIPNHMPYLLKGIYQILRPFTGLDLLPQSSISADEILAVLQDESARSLQRKMSTSTNILNHAILTQFDINLCDNITAQNISVSWSQKGDQLDLNKLEDLDQSASFLLVSGRNKSQDVIFGLLNPRGSEDQSIQPFMIQLAPLHRVFNPLSGTVKCTISLDRAGGSPTLAAQMCSSKHKDYSATLDNLESHQSVARLVVHGRSGHFTLLNGASIDENLLTRTPIDEHFFVDAIELLKSDFLEYTGGPLDEEVPRKPFI